MFGLIAELHVLPAGHVGRGSAPAHHPLITLPEESRAVGCHRPIVIGDTSNWPYHSVRHRVPRRGSRTDRQDAESD
jgi:hypothetical protein